MTSSLLARPDRASLAGHLFYDSFDPDGRLFVHRDGSLALAWELGMKDTETSTPSALREIADRVADFFRHLPAGSAGQFILMSERDIQGVLGRFRAAGTPGHRLEGLFDAHCQMLESLSISHGGAVFSGRTLRLYFTLRIFPDLGKKEEAIRAAYAREKGLLLEQAKAIEGFFSQLSLPARRLDAGEMVSLLFRILNPQRSRGSAPRPYREDLPIRDQVVRSALRFDYDSGVLTVDGLSTKVLSMVQIPQETTPGMVSRPAASGLGVLDLIPEAVLIFNVAVLDDADCRHRLEKRDAFAWRQLQGPRKKLDLVRIKEDAEFALGELMNGRRALGVRFHVLVSDPSSERVEEKARSVAGTLDRLGIEMVKEDALGLSLFLQGLPMMYEPPCDRGLKRSFTMLSSNLADMLPLYGSFRGTPTPDVLLQNRRGEPVTLSLFDSDVAAHTVVTGVSGAGKSFFMNYLLASARRRGGHVIVLDKGNSYRNLSEIDGGQYVVFDPNRPLRINPIGRAEEMDKERLLFVKDTINLTGRQPVNEWSDFETRGTLEEAFVNEVGHFRTERTVAPAYILQPLHDLQVRLWGDYTNVSYYESTTPEQDRDGNILRIGVTFPIDLHLDWSLAPYVTYDRYDAQGSDYKSHGWEGGVTVLTPVYAGFKFALTASYGVQDYDKPNSLTNFTKKRLDRPVSGTLVIIFKQLENALGAAPSISVTWYRHQSNISAFNYTRWAPQMELGITALSF